ncbi:glycosyltransferase [Mycobacterium angelicum]|uniref:Glycosyltransferase n=1 Tax=Mycobacterium angelicum TaxID=470074 RepID=A0A1W9ZPS4_MYCAN|nr:glycosyltransferase [Mycobacterium angelicum]MCV7199099.1 glycosyltransferase [Mycobacterium angelicum]ORA19608.1 glycosyltransferase [Mycobacterium angelicum]
MRVVLAAYGSRGDVEPCAAVGLELARRGHSVCMAVPPNLVGFVESAGLIAVAYGPDSREEQNPASDLARKFATQVQNPVSMLSEVIEHVSLVNLDKSATLTSLTDGADLLVASFNEQGLAANVAEYQGIPLAAVHPFPARIWASGGAAPLITTAVEGAQRAALGLPEAEPAPPALEIQAYDELCLPKPADQWVQPDARRPFVGALTLQLPTDTDETVLSWIAAGKPPIFFGFGSTPLARAADTVAMIEAACAQLGERALICGNGIEPTQSDHLMAVGAVNHAAIFPACRAVVHHGGAGTTAAGMRAGIPTLILWFWLDQPLWAAAVTELEVGAARAFSATTRDSLVSDLGAILGPGSAVRARAVAAEMTDPAVSVAAAADLLDGLARPG